MAETCNPGECEGDPTYEEPIPVNPYPEDAGSYTGKSVVVDELPDEGVEGVIYWLVKPGTDAYDLYQWINGDWRKLDLDIKLYQETGTETDGAMTQKATTDALKDKADKSSLAKVATSGSYTDLDDQPTIPDAQIQSDWNQDTVTAKDYIKNKPTIPDAQIQSDWDQTNTNAKDYIKNKPTIPDAQIQSDWEQSNTNAKDYIKNKPTIPDAQIQSDWGQSDTNAKDYIKNKPTIPDAQIQSDWDQTDTDAKDFIKNKPTIPSGVVLYSSTGQNTDGAMTQKAVTDELANKQAILTFDAEPTTESTNPVTSRGVKTYVDGLISWRQRKPVVVWEVDGEVVTTGLVAVGEDISANPNWQLTGLDLTPYKRIKIFTKAAQKAGATASASTTPAMVLEMSLDSRAAIAEYGNNFVGSMLAQKPNDANRLCTLTCAVSADKTKFEVLRMTSLYGTAATSNSDVNAYVFKIEGYYD